MTTDDEQQFLRQGYLIAPVEQRQTLDRLRTDVLGLIEEFAQAKIGDLTRLHEFVSRERVNEIRVRIYNALNDRPSFLDDYYAMAQSCIERIVGNELAAQQRVNLSILMPQDDGSQLKLHSDTMSGQSEYEAVLWIPLTDVHDTNSVYVMDFDVTREMFAQLPAYHAKGMDALYEDYKRQATFIEMQYGQFLLFTPTLFHGSVVNQTATTRVSLNVRFKGLFTPYYAGDETEKKLGSFYRPFRVRPTTQIALRHKEPIFG